MIRVKVKEALQERGKSLYWLSKETGINYPSLHRLANNPRDGIRFSTLNALCRALNCQPSDLLEYVPD